MKRTPANLGFSQRLVVSPYLNFGAVCEDGSRNKADFFWNIVHTVSVLNQELDRT